MLLLSASFVYGDQKSASPGSSQSSAAAPASTTPTPAPPVVHGILTLDGPWRFQVGDDLRWAERDFDDSRWPTISLSQSLSDQGFEPYTGYAWYRIHLQPQQAAALGDTSTAPLELLLTPNSVGQLEAYVDGQEAGRTRGMTEDPTEYQSHPIEAQFSAPNAAGVRVLAIRAWAGPTVTIRRGLLERVQLGTQPEIADRLALASAREWNERVLAPLFLAFLFSCVCALGTALYIAQRHHTEYLWLALLCLSVAIDASFESSYGSALISLTVYRIFSIFVGHIFMAITLEFVLRFTATPPSRLVRGVQAAVLLLPLVYFVHIDQIFEALTVAAEVLFLALVCVLLFRAWRRGRNEAGVMFLPFILAATAGSADTVLDYAAYKHWLPDRFASHHFHLGPAVFSTGAIAYSIFLVSLVAVILYRFIRVSQQEQRANAEVSAARSVQALLIPTQLPSNKNFMLESAYLPVHGVGGDFFQVLPLKDDSLLIVVGDVSGKGLQAAMNSSTLVGALRNELSHDPATVLDHLNHVLLGAVPTPGAVPELDAAPCFATCLCARVYPDGTLTIANAGHLSPYRDGREMPLSPSLPLGVIADNHYEQMTFHLNRGDRLVFISDGVVEATNHEGELFGFERTQQVSHEPARYIAQTAKHFGQTDDITVVSLYVASRAASRAEEPAYSS